MNDWSVCADPMYWSVGGGGFGLAEVGDILGPWIPVDLYRMYNELLWIPKLGSGGNPEFDPGLEGPPWYEDQRAWADAEALPYAELCAAAEAAFIEGFKRCAPVAEELKVYATLETSFSVEQLQRIVDAVGSHYVGVYQDVANALHYGHEPVDMLTRLGKRISMIHIKDKGGELLGEGEVDWDKCVEAIKEMGYDGWLVLETKPTSDPRRAAAENLRFIRNAIQEAF